MCFVGRLCPLLYPSLAAVPLPYFVREETTECPFQDPFHGTTNNCGSCFGPWLCLGFTPGVATRSSRWCCQGLACHATRPEAPLPLKPLFFFVTPFAPGVYSSSRSAFRDSTGTLVFFSPSGLLSLDGGWCLLISIDCSRGGYFNSSSV